MKKFNLRQAIKQPSLRKAEAGQSLVEFAIALPFLIILLMVMVEVGFLLRTHTSIVAAVRESTRTASASGNSDPFGTDAAYTPTQTDGDAQVVNLVNIMVRDGGSNPTKTLDSINLVMSYRADSTAGRTSSSPSASGAGDGTARVWPIVTTSVGPPRTINPGQTNFIEGSPYQRIFARTSGTTGTFSTQVLQGSACTSALTLAGFASTTSPNSFPCGRNWDTSATAAAVNQPPRKTDLFVGTTNAGGCNTSKFCQDPWNPVFRRCLDIDQGITTDITQANTSSAYFNNPATSSEWIGVRIDYTYSWATGFFPMPAMKLSDRSVKILEPNPASCS